MRVFNHYEHLGRGQAYPIERTYKTISLLKPDKQAEKTTGELLEGKHMAAAAFIRTPRNGQKARSKLAVTAL